MPRPAVLSTNHLASIGAKREDALTQLLAEKTIGSRFSVGSVIVDGPVDLAEAIARDIGPAAGGG